MILTDEHNIRTLGCYRDILRGEQSHVWGENVEVLTPNIDRLASEGAIFSNFYTVAPLCTPSRASFMTGLYPPKTGGSRVNHGRMDDDMITFAQILRDQRGYDTGYFGKWHLNGDAKPGWGNDERKFGFTDTTYQVSTN
jgi:arylsulfatase A-like enzyme